MDILLTIVVYTMQILILFMLVSMLMSWIDPEMRFGFSRAIRGLINPLILPIRSIIPPVGVLDLSFLFAALLLFIMTRFVIQAGGRGFLPF